MIEVKVPELGENIETAEVLRVIVSEGEEIQPEQSILELESDKAAVEMPSPEAGTVTEIRVGEGDEVRVGQVVMVLDGEAEADEEEAKADEDEAEADEDEAEADEDEAEADEDEAEADEDEAEADEDEAEADEDEAEAEADEDEAEADEDEAEPDEDEAEKEQHPTEAEVEEPAALVPEKAADVAGPAERRAQKLGRASDWKPVAAGPATRRLARELGVRIEEVEPTGGDRLVTRSDVKQHVRNTQPQKRGRSSQSLPDFSRWGEVEHTRMSRLGRTAAERLQRAWAEIPHVTQHDLADVTELEAARGRFLEREPDTPLTVTALAVKASVAALREFPLVNSSFDSETEELIYKRYYNIGVAVDTDRGLLVPVVRNADSKTTRELAEEIARLAERARAGRLDPDEMAGGTFTITNLGGIGGTAFTPIIRWPEVAILGVSRTRVELMQREGELVSRTLLPLSLSYDHRVINGADAARFVRYLSRLLEEPLALMMEL